MSEAAAEVLYHAATKEDWTARSTEYYQPASYADEGFVHASSAGQLIDTLHRHYPGRDDLILLTIAPAALSSELIWEDLYGSGVEFPHIYGPVELAAVTAATPIPCDDAGRFDWWRP
ncbi:MAG: DUF952 domain-containing protein [Acidimicrobiales bacterium]